MVERMSVQDIVKKYCDAKKPALNWKHVYASIQQVINHNTHRVFRTNNTLFLIQLGAPHEAEVFVINADPYKKLHQNLTEFCAAMHKAGFKKVWAETEDINLLNTVKKIGYPMEINQIGTGESGHPLYRGTVNV